MDDCVCVYIYIVLTYTSICPYTIYIIHTWIYSIYLHIHRIMCYFTTLCLQSWVCYIHIFIFTDLMKSKNTLKKNYASRNTEEIVPSINILSFKQIGTHGNWNTCHSSVRSIAYCILFIIFYHFLRASAVKRLIGTGFPLFLIYKNDCCF